MSENVIQINLDEVLKRINTEGLLPDPCGVNMWSHYKHRHLWLDFEVSEEALEVAKTIMLWNRQDDGLPKEERQPIYIMLENYGGDSDMCWMLIDVIRLSKTPVYTVNMGMCASAAGLIFIAGHKRFMLPGATVMIHSGSASMSGDAQKVLDASDSYKKDLKKMREFILSNTSIPAAQLNRKKSNDWSIDAQYCIDNGVCDRIIESLDEVL